MINHTTTEVVEVKTSDLIYEALDWAVVMCLGFTPAKREKRNWGYETVPAPELVFSRILTSKDNPGNSVYQRNLGFSTDWSQGGPIIEMEQISTCWGGTIWVATRFNKKYEGTWYGHQYGPTPLIAAMRCYVASKLGDTVEIPKELTK